MTKLKDTEKAVSDLKSTAEALFSTPESGLVDAFPDFELFEARLNSLIATVARYRIQLGSPEEKLVFGPKTLKAVEALVADYDKLYEIYEEHIAPAFAGVRPLYEEAKKAARAPCNEETDHVRSIHEETKSHLRQIDEWKRTKERPGVKEVDFEAIQRKETELRGLLGEIMAVYKAESCGSLAEAVTAILDAHPEPFFEIVDNVTHLLGEIARKPDEVALRLLRINNEKLQADFLAFPASVKLLRHAGFRVATTDDVEPHLAKLGCKFEDEFFLYLPEPDMFTFYNRWKAWLDHLNGVYAKLDYFLKTYKPLRRTGVDVRLLVGRCLAEPARDGEEEQQNRGQAAP